LAIGQFVTIFIGSLSLGVGIALLAAITFKYTSISAYPYLETALVALYAYSSYLLAEGLHLSGIVAILFCGIAMSQYAFVNLSEESQVSKLIFSHSH
jgi:NhaP-type Na+/H+ or K+/H+ antiporter